MGIKMREAFHVKTNTIIDVEHATDLMRKNKELQCKNSKCNAKLTWVERHKEVGEIKTRFFRLLTKDDDHAPICSYNTLGRMKVIAGDSDDEVMKNLENGKYEFRLNIIHEAIEFTKKHGDITEENRYAGKEEHQEKEYLRGKKLLPYLGKMKKVMLLRSEIDGNDELKKCVKLVFGKQRISWDNFYFERNGFEECYSYIVKNGVGIKNYSNLRHPICVQSEVKDIVTKPLKGKEYHYIALKSPYNPQIGLDVSIPSVSVRTENKDIMESLKTYKMEHGKYPEIVVYSLFSANMTPKVVPQNGKMLIFKDVSGDVFHKHQIAIVKEL